MKLKATTSRYAANTQRTAILSEDMLPNAYRALRPTKWKNESRTAVR